MYKTLDLIKSTVYDKIGLKLSQLIIEKESVAYEACQFQLNNLNIISRTSKTTPKKIGQFATIWKRSENGPIEPFTEKDLFDFFVVTVKDGDQLGQFVFPKVELIKRRIISTTDKEGKRAFRVYPDWVIVNSKQAERTQKWQQEFFYSLEVSLNIEKILRLYNLTIN